MLSGGPFLPACYAYEKKMGDNKPLYVVFRYDDISSESNIDVERKIIQIFRSINASITVGVIPFTVADGYYDLSDQLPCPLSNEKVETLKDAANQGILEIALHGYIHKMRDAQHQNEFVGLDFQWQRDMFSKGKSDLEDKLCTPVTTFLPPWQVYDHNTLKALEDLKFTTISGLKSGKAISSSNLKFLPVTCSIVDLKSGLLAARKVFHIQPIVVVLFHAYDFNEVDRSRGVISIQEFSNLMNWLASQDEVNVISIRQATEIVQDLSVKRFLLAQQKTPLSVFIASTLAESVNTKFLYREINIPTMIWVRVIGFYLFILGLAVVSSFLFAHYVLSKNEILKIIMLVSVIINLFALIYTFHDKYIYRRGAMACSLLIGFSIGLLISYLLST